MSPSMIPMIGDFLLIATNEVSTVFSCIMKIILDLFLSDILQHSKKSTANSNLFSKKLGIKLQALLDHRSMC